MNLKIAGICLLLLSLLSACGDHNVQLDNATAGRVEFSIDGQSYEVDPGERTEIDLEAGDHKLKLTSEAGEVMAEESFKLKEGGLIHAGGTKYVVWRRLYGDPSVRDEILNEDWTEIDSLKMYGDFKIFEPEEHFIESRWDLNLSESFEEEEYMFQSQDFEVKAKIFRSKELKEFYTSLSQQVTD